MQEINLMNLLDFGSYFPDEESCIEHFKVQREKIGIFCKRCNNTTHYWKKDKIAFQCVKCRSYKPLFGVEQF